MQKKDEEIIMRKVSENQDHYAAHYDDTSFWNKLGTLEGVGRELLEKALALYYCMKDPSVPFKAKAAIIAGLGYLILPLDVVPDIIPIVGYADDLAVLCFVYNEVASHITEQHLEQARSKLGSFQKLGQDPE